MPEERVWASFLDPDAILSKLGLTAACRDAVEVGCGYGTFTIPAARIIARPGATVVRCMHDSAHCANKSGRTCHSCWGFLTGRPMRTVVANNATTVAPNDSGT